MMKRTVIKALPTGEKTELRLELLELNGDGWYSVVEYNKVIDGYRYPETSNDYVKAFDRDWETL